MSGDVAVSIICNTYNQESYIQDALESFLSQKTNFEFEVLVHDDASNDSTAKIICEYEKKYPKIIKPIYQKVNQYSQGKSVSLTYQFPRVKGKYVAFCEGDDYYTCNDKIQRQFDILESITEVDMCSHAAFEVQENTKKTIAKTVPQKYEGILSANQVIKGGGGYLATNSLMFRRKLIDSIPEFRKFFPIDYSLQIQGALRGGIYYDSAFMSAHRIAANNSWTISIKKDPAKRLAFNHRLEEMLKILDQETAKKYHEAIQERLVRVRADDFWYSGNFKFLLKKENNLLYQSLSLREKMLLRLHIYCPFLFDR